MGEKKGTLRLFSFSSSSSNVQTRKVFLQKCSHSFIFSLSGTVIVTKGKEGGGLGLGLGLGWVEGEKRSERKKKKRLEISGI